MKDANEKVENELVGWIDLGLVSSEQNIPPSYLEKKRKKRITIIM